jgi:hypothetical protein
MDVAITGADSTGGVVSMIGDAGLKDASAAASTAVGSEAAIVASTAIAVSKAVAGSAAAPEGSTAAVVNFMAVEAVDSMVVVDTEAGTGKTAKYLI